MVDHLTPEQRSRQMSKVKNKNTKPELRLRSALHKLGFRFRLHRKDLPGTPDIFLPKYKLAVFVHGCFWHGHEDCRRSKLPATRPEFWQGKITRNMQRDAATARALSEGGFRVVVFWECEIGRLNDVETLILERFGDSLDGPAI